MIADYLLWLVAGLILIIVEVMSGSFYLLVLGLAAFAGALASFFAAGAILQVLFAGLVAVVGLVAVNRWHVTRREHAEPDRSLDLGQMVTLESWVDKSARLVRVKYRGTSWNAHLIGDTTVQVNDVLYICGNQGSNLQVSRSSNKS